MKNLFIISAIIFFAGNSFGQEQSFYLIQGFESQKRLDSIVTFGNYKDQDSIILNKTINTYNEFDQLITNIFYSDYKDDNGSETDTSKMERVIYSYDNNGRLKSHLRLLGGSRYDKYYDKFGNIVVESHYDWDDSLELWRGCHWGGLGYWTATYDSINREVVAYNQLWDDQINNWSYKFAGAVRKYDSRGNFLSDKNLVIDSICPKDENGVRHILWKSTEKNYL